MTKLEALTATAQYIQDFNMLDCNCIVCDKEGLILHHLPPKTFDDKVKVGIKVTNSSVETCRTTKKKFIKVIPEQALGIKLKMIMCPVFEDNGEFSGVVAIANNIDAQKTLNTSAQSIASTSEEVTATTEELSSSAFTLAQSLLEIKSTIGAVVEEINKTDEILKFVDHIADNSGMLSINAAIEAARAGEQGKGFGVVAEKIGEMAENSATSVKNIRKIIETIQAKITKLEKIVNNAVELGQQQAAATEEIESVMQELSVTASEVERIAEAII
jgi:hypothetical protein